jgi:hypothetical protein
MESINPDDDSWVSATGLFGILAVWTFMTARLSPAVMQRIVWYNHAPESLKSNKVWVVWIFMDLMVGICLYTVAINVEDFSAPNNKLIHSPLVIFSMIALTQIIEKLWVPLCRHLDVKYARGSKGKTTEYTEKERIEALSAEINTERYYNTAIPTVSWVLKVYSVGLFLSALVTLVLISVEFKRNDSYKTVMALWVVVTFICLIGMIATFWNLKGALKVTPLQ